ncbi:speckle-type POZ protein-like A [Schistocerca cancellata]|uniref:speckle-type POZ protein-like A n=1 Tax=Schistocerca cancellata TaxID=274614 RepID=UPI0021184623|nr:speckle-type POZ protein-like A [Schistocerca cancellata]
MAQLLVAADKYDLPLLKDAREDHSVQNLSAENVAECAVLASSVTGDGKTEAHRVILAAGSPVFPARLPHHIAEAASGCLQVPVVEAATVEHFVSCEYTDEVPDGKRNAAKPQAPAETCRPPPLKEACEEHSVQGFTLEDVAECVVLTSQHVCSHACQMLPSNSSARTPSKSREWKAGETGQPAAHS